MAAAPGVPMTPNGCAPWPVRPPGRPTTEDPDGWIDGGTPWHHGAAAHAAGDLPALRACGGSDGAGQSTAREGSFRPTGPRPTRSPRGVPTVTISRLDAHPVV